MVAELISVGTELLLGNITNTNASFLAEQCARAGLSCYYQVTVGDNKDRLKEVVKTALDRSDVIILTGGLGPTEDDLTKEAVADVLGLPMVEDEHTRQRIEAYLKNTSRKKITENNWRQAMIPQGAQVIDNHNGTAPGLILSSESNKKIVLLPGPHEELISMVKTDIYPFLDGLVTETIQSVTVKISGIGESFVETAIQDLIEAQDNPTIAPYAKTGEVHLRITAKAENKKEAKKLIKPVLKEIRNRFGTAIYTIDVNKSLEECVVSILRKKELTLTTAESCTAGMLASRIVNVPGASEVLSQGLITYSNKAKRNLLGVKKETLKNYGAVSEQCAKEMAKGAAKLAKSDAAISITGIAGPDGGTEEKPVGLVYIGCYYQGSVVVEKYNFKGNRQKNREYSVAKALDLLRRCII